MRKRVVRALRPLDPVSIENGVGVGTPDVNFVGGWLELKSIEAWPARADTIVRVDHLHGGPAHGATSEFEDGRQMLEFKGLPYQRIGDDDRVAYFAGEAEDCPILREGRQKKYLLSTTPGSEDEWVLDMFLKRATKKLTEEVVSKTLSSPEAQKILGNTCDCNCGGPPGHVPNGVWCRRGL